MYQKTTAVISVFVITNMVGACSGDTNKVDNNNNNENSTASSNVESSGSSSRQFFNADQGLDFANILGGSLSRIFSSATGSGNAVSGSREESIFTTRATQSETTLCDSGSIDTVVQSDDTTAETSLLAITFNDCSTDGDLATGAIIMRFSGPEDNLQISLAFEDFETVDADGNASVNGELNMTGSLSGDNSNFTVSGSSLSMMTDEESISFGNYTLTVTENDTAETSAIGGQAQIITSTDGTLNLTIDPPLTQNNSESDYPQSGRMTMIHNDGSQLEIQADNGNSESFDYVITSNGNATSGTELWVNSDLIID